MIAGIPHFIALCFIAFFKDYYYYYYFYKLKVHANLASNRSIAVIFKLYLLW